MKQKEMANGVVSYGESWNYGVSKEELFCKRITKEISLDILASNCFFFFFKEKSLSIQIGIRENQTWDLGDEYILKVSSQHHQQVIFYEVFVFVTNFTRVKLNFLSIGNLCLHWNIID